MFLSVTLMAFLARLLKLLRFIENTLEALAWLETPVGRIAILTLVLYGSLAVWLGDATTAMTLAGSVALVCACILTKPDF